MTDSNPSKLSPARTRSRSKRARQSATRRGPVETRSAILDAAESLFIEMGYAGTSLRAIATRAGVNLASAHYHFGSKAGLLGAVIHLRVGPASEEREKGLITLLEQNPHPTVEEILAVFFSPLASGGVSANLPRLMARLYGEPESVSKPLIEREFGSSARRFLAALGNALPDIDEDTLAWRFHLMIGSMIQMLAFERPPSMEGSKLRSEDRLAHLLAFAVAGITDGAAGASRESRT